MYRQQNRKYKRQQWKKRGLCSECGKPLDPLDDNNKSTCKHCRELSAARKAKQRSK